MAAPVTDEQLPKSLDDPLWTNPKGLLREDDASFSAATCLSWGLPHPQEQSRVGRKGSFLQIRLAYNRQTTSIVQGF